MSAPPPSMADAKQSTNSVSQVSGGSATSSSTSSGPTASTSSGANTTPASSTQASGPSQEELTCRWNQCNEVFASAESLYDHLCERHVGRKSTNNLNLTCQWNSCRTTTVKRDHITSHIRVHVPLKPHKCDFCPKTFKRPQDLKKHVKTHADDSVLVVNAGDNRMARGPGAMGNTAPYSYDQNAMRNTHQPLGQPHQNNQAAYSSYPPHTSTYGNGIYYGTAPPPRQAMFPQSAGPPTASYGGGDRKRSYDSTLGTFFSAVKHQRIDTNDYQQINRGLMNIQRSLPINEYISHSNNLPPINPGGVGAVGVEGPVPQYYALPRTSEIRTKADLLELDRNLEAMQNTVYDSDPAIAAQAAQAVSAYSQNQVHIRQSQSPPHVHAQPQALSGPGAYPQVSAAHMSSPLSAISPAHSTGTPAVSPPSSTMSYPSSNSPGASPGSSSFSPVSRFSSAAGQQLYPSLSQAPSSSSNMTPTLGGAFDRTRRQSGSLLQRANQSRQALNSELPSSPLPTPKEMESGASSPAPSESTAPSEDSDDDYQETWIENVRCIEWLREAIRYNLANTKFEDDDNVTPEDEENRPSSPKDVVMGETTPTATTPKVSSTKTSVPRNTDSLYPDLKAISSISLN